jgi:hypothetical protein
LIIWESAKKASSHGERHRRPDVLFRKRIERLGVHYGTEAHEPFGPR